MKNRAWGWRLAALVGIAATMLLVVNGSADTVVYLSNETAFLNDTWINSNSATSNYGSGNLTFGNYASAARIYSMLFNLKMPAGAGEISKIVLSLYCYASTDYPTYSRNLQVFELNRSYPAFTELGATWNKYDGTSNWNVAGGDYNSTLITIKSISTDCSASPTWFNLTLLGGATGWNVSWLTWGSNISLIVNTSRTDAFDASHYFRSCESAANNPKLYVEYTPTTTTLPPTTGRPFSISPRTPSDEPEPAQLYEDCKNYTIKNRLDGPLHLTLSLSGNQYVLSTYEIVDSRDYLSLSTSSLNLEGGENQTLRVCGTTLPENKVYEASVYVYSDTYSEKIQVKMSPQRVKEVSGIGEIDIFASVTGLMTWGFPTQYGDLEAWMGVAAVTSLIGLYYLGQSIKRKKRYSKEEG